MGERLPRRQDAGRQLRLLRPHDRNRAAWRSLPAGPRHAAGMGQREHEGQECSGTESVHAYRISQRLLATNMRTICSLSTSLLFFTLTVAPLLAADNQLTDQEK